MRGFIVSKLKFTKNKQSAIFDFRTTVVDRAGSTYTMRYHKPRSRIKLPFDLKTNGGQEKDKPLRKHKPMIEEVDDKLSADKFLPQETAINHKPAKKHLPE
jgi:hypothetical protein